MGVIELAWEDCHYWTAHRLIAEDAPIAGLPANLEDKIDFGSPIGEVAALDILRLNAWYQKIKYSYFSTTSNSWEVQLAALVFLATRNPYALNPYFPITNSLNKAELKGFCQLIQAIIRNQNFDLHLFAVHQGATYRKHADMTNDMPAHIVYLVAGHLAETFFYRRDILERLLSSPCRFWLYSTQDIFKRHGGQAGGNYDSTRGAIQLVLSRLYEGFYGKTPGVAPFLHEFGHMLDHLDASTGKLGKANGLLPGMRPEDGDIYTPEAREAFLKGKKIELERYLKLHEQGYSEGDPLPIGHPYVFQNDGEFIAGYFEMFFRNPHYFAALNPDLYEGFSKLFKQDPRLAWAEDFPFYIEQNRGFYLSGERPPQPGITVE
jgi:hypothetical protein